MSVHGFLTHKYMGTSLMRNSAPLRTYKGTMPRTLWCP
jgi:hypothetical protein